MTTESKGFPFSIMDVAALLRLNIRRRGPGFAYADCPVCGDKRGKLKLYLDTDVWHCYYCGEGGGMLALYGKAHGVGNSEAYREICDALMTDGYAPPTQTVSTKNQSVTENTAPQAERAPIDELHRTYSAMLSMLSLWTRHREHLRTVRGLTDEQIDAFGFKSTPDPFLCRSIASRLKKQGCVLQGVPGFYMDKKGYWTVRFYSKTAGILIPIRDINGRIQGLQTRLDHPIKGNDAPPEKSGVKYLTLSSTDKTMGASSGTPVHFVGNPNARVVYVTEGALKADIAHALTGRSFLATIGAGNVSQLDGIFAFLRRNGTEEIIEAEDMDKYRNKAVSQGAFKVYQLAKKNGLSCRRLTWNPTYKGIDDWQLALRKQKERTKEIKMSETGERMQFFRIYQIDMKLLRTVPYAFRSMDEMRSMAISLPIADDYRLIYDSMIRSNTDESADEILARIYERFNILLPEDYRGHSLSMSDVVELYDTKSRQFYYCDSVGFVPIPFSPLLARPMEKAD